MLAMLADELYLAMLEVGHATRRHKIPGPLAHTMIDIAQNSRLSSSGKMTGQPFGSRRGCRLARPTRGTTWQIPDPGWSGCWNTLVVMADSKLSAL